MKSLLQIARVGTAGVFMTLAGCATTVVPTDVATTGMPNAELALRHSIDKVDAQLTQIGGMRPSLASAAASTAGQPVSLAPPAPGAQQPIVLASAAAPPPRAGAPVLLAPPSTASSQGLQVVPDALQKPIQFTWHGPLDAGVRKLAASIGYTVAVIAPPNPHPVPVSVNVQGQVIGVFQSLGDQAGSAATVEVDPLRHSVQVIHHV